MARRRAGYWNPKVEWRVGAAGFALRPQSQIGKPLLHRENFGFQFLQIGLKFISLFSLGLEAAAELGSIVAVAFTAVLTIT